MKILFTGILAAALLCGCAGTAQGGAAGRDDTTTQGGTDKPDSTGTVDNTGQGALGGQVQGSQNRLENQGIQGSLNGQGQETPVEEVPEPVVFEAQDLEGNTVTSDIFGESKLTMVNVWATYCNPCLREMPELGELAGEYDAGTFRLIGVVSDVQEGADQEILDAVEGLVTDTGADYTHLLLNLSLYNGMLTDVTAVPTTFFVDEEGIIVGSVVGARDKASWKEIIDGYLEEQ